MKSPVWWVLLSVMGSLIGAGILFLVSRPPVGEAVELLPAPTSPPLVVYVTGAVATPGVYTMPAGSRVGEAIEMAGGITDQADSGGLNLAQVVTDGQRIDVPALSPTSTEEASGEVTTRSVELTTGLININTATQEELESLPEIGPYLASEIIAYREANGSFETIDELLEVTGIGPVTFEAIRELVTVGG